MNPNDPNILIVFDGNIAYVGIDTDGRFFVKHKTDSLLSVHVTLTSALLAAAKECGAVP